MKQHIGRIHILIVAVLVSVFLLPPFQAKAGLSEITLDAEMITDNNWNDPEGDVKITDDYVLVFSKDSSEYTRYITKSSVKKDERCGNMIEFDGSIKFTQIPEGQSFILAFGLESIETYHGEANNVEVSFTNNGGIKVGITAYDEKGAAQYVAAEKACGISMNQAANVNIKMRADQTIIVSVNSNTIFTEKLPNTGEGRFGFLQTGKCGAEISNILIKQYEYATPENTNVHEDFEKGGIDLSKLTARTIDMFSVFPRGQFVDVLEDNHVMRLLNTQRAYIGTVYQYSNFELTFDVPYMNIETKWVDGVRTKIGQQSMYVSFGGEQAEWNSDGWKSAVETVVLNSKQVYSFNDKEGINAELKKDPWAEKGRPFSVKVKVVDSIVSVGVKWLEEETFDEVLNYQLKSGTPTGHIHIWVPGEGNCAIDNVNITNLDLDANIIETEFISGKMNIPEDYAYEPMERIYIEDTVKTEGETQPSFDLWYLLIPVVTAVGTIAIIITTVLVRKKKREGTEDVQ